MKIGVVSYSFTGNNEALAAAVAKLLSAEHVKIVESKPRKMGTIMADMIFNRSPKSQPSPDALSQYEQVILMGPVWMGNVAAPLRAYLKYIKQHPQPYAFACVSGGGLNSNPKLEGEIARRAGAQPMAYIDLHIADLQADKESVTTDDTGTYHLSVEEVEKLSGTIADAIKSRMKL